MNTRKYKLRLGLALLVSLGALAGVFLSGVSPRLGLDLEGGTSVILTASSSEGEVEPQVLEKTVDIIRQRIDALGVAEPEVSASGSNNILVQLPGVEDEQRALELIGSTAQLTFRQVLEIIPRGEPSPPQQQGKGKGKAKAKQGPQADEQRAPAVTESTGAEVNDEQVVYPSAEDPNTLYRLAPAGELTGDVITDAQAVVDANGNWVVTLDMNKRGAEAWAKLTSRLACLRDRGEQVRSQVAIVLDGRVETATGMRDPATAPQGQGVECGTGITGGQSQIDVGSEQEAKDLALVLQTGALPLTLEQSQVQKVSPTLGRDSLEAGLLAGVIGLALVFVYMLFYYRALGLVAWAGLIVFTATVYALLSLLGKFAGLTLTLAGVAGVIVSIGVTTDSYIVAFERLKDELRSGKSMRAAVERGMVRAFRTILVADFVTASAAVILFFLAVGPVRGFALTLGISTAVDVLVAYFFTRPAVILLSRYSLFSEGRWVGMREALGAGRA